MSADQMRLFGLLSVAFRGLRSGSGGFAVFSRLVGSEVPRNAATANAAPHTNASAALSVFKPLPAMPRTRPETTDKLTNVRTAESHFMVLGSVSAVAAVPAVAVRSRQN